MGNTKSVDSGDTPNEPILSTKERPEEKLLGQAASDTALNKKVGPTLSPSASSSTAVAELKSKKKDGNRSATNIEGKSKSPALTSGQRQILKYCINNSKDDLGERIFRRVADKREDFRNYFEDLPKAERLELTDDLRLFIIKIAELASESDCATENLEAICRGFGERYAHHDFKPDFVSIANAMTTECVFLDGAAHMTTETLTAWSQLTSTVFSMVRDGYYAELRRLRRVSNSTTGSAKEADDPITPSSTTPLNKQDSIYLNDDDQVSSKSNDSAGEEQQPLEQQNNRVRFETTPQQQPQFLAPPSANF